MSSPTNELYTLILAKFTADTGSGGLNEAGGVALLNGSMYRAGDTNDRGLNWPKIVVGLASIDESDAMAFDRVEILTQFDVVAKADNRFAAMDAVVARVRALYHKWTPSVGTQWDFGNFRMRGEGQVSSGNINEHRYTIRFRVGARKVA